MRGVHAMVLGIIGGAILGAVAAALIIMQLKMEADYAVYASGFSVSSIPYSSRLFEIYYTTDFHEFLNETESCFLITGGPRFCGYVKLGDLEVAVWRNESSGCNYLIKDPDEKKLLIEKAWERCESEAAEKTFKKANLLGMDGILVENGSLKLYYHITKNLEVYIEPKLSLPEPDPELLASIERTLNGIPTEHGGTVERIIKGPCENGMQTVIHEGFDRYERKIYVGEVKKCSPQ